MSQLFVVDEVRGLLESEVMFLKSIVVVHQHPFLLADAFPHGRRFAGLWLFVYPARREAVIAVYPVRDGLLDAGSPFVGHIGEDVLAVGMADVAIDGCRGSVGVLKQQLGFRGQLIELVVHIHVVEAVGLALEPHGEVNHQLALFLVVDGLWCPCASYLCKLWREAANVHNLVAPMYQVPRFHQHESFVVAPSIGFAVAFPFGGALAFSLCVDVEVGHGQIEGSVRSPVDVRVAYALLVGYGVAGHDGVGIVEGGEVIAVSAQCHVQAVRVVAVEHHEVCAHVVLGRYAVLIFESVVGDFPFADGAEGRP